MVNPLMMQRYLTSIKRKNSHDHILQKMYINAEQGKEDIREVIDKAMIILANFSQEVLNLDKQEGGIGKQNLTSRPPHRINTSLAHTTGHATKAIR